MASQLSGLLPKTLERRSAISGDTLLSPLIKRVKVEGDIFRFVAAFLDVIPFGVRYRSLINSPGWGGLNIVISDSPHS
jgi:hypothetical protein